MFEPKTKTVRRWLLVGYNFRVDCRTKSNAVRWGRMARMAGKDLRLIEEYDLFDREQHIDHQEFDRTVLILPSLATEQNN